VDAYIVTSHAQEAELVRLMFKDLELDSDEDADE
jgi:hypothetical protein